MKTTQDKICEHCGKSYPVLPFRMNVSKYFSKGRKAVYVKAAELAALCAVAEDAEWMHNLLETLLQCRGLIEQRQMGNRLPKIKKNLASLAAIRNPKP